MIIGEFLFADSWALIFLRSRVQTPLQRSFSAAWSSRGSTSDRASGLSRYHSAVPVPAPHQAAAGAGGAATTVRPGHVQVHESIGAARVLANRLPLPNLYTASNESKISVCLFLNLCDSIV